MTENPDAVKVGGMAVAGYRWSTSIQAEAALSGAILGARAMRAAMPAPAGVGEDDTPWISVWLSDPPPTPAGHLIEVKRDGLMGTVIAYRFVAQPDPAIEDAGAREPSPKKLREAYALSDLICPETTTVEAEMLGIWQVLSGQDAGGLEGAEPRGCPTPGACSCPPSAPTPAGAGDLVERLPEKVRSHMQFLAANASGFDMGVWSEICGDVLEAASRIEALEAEVAREKLRADAEAAEVNVLTHQRDAFRRDRNLAEYRATTAEADLAALRSNYDTAQANWDLTLDRAEKTEADLAALRAEVERVAKEGPDAWLIRKGAYYYRPNCQGYTTSKSEAGRYTEAKAKSEASVEPWHMSAILADDVPGPPTTDAIRAQARMEALEEAIAAAKRCIWAAFNEEEAMACKVLLGDIVASIRALAGKPGEAEGWRSLDDCPNDGRLVWVAGGRYSSDPEIQTADGDWWRSEAKRGSKAVPNVWMPLNVPAPPADGGGDGE